MELEIQNMRSIPHSRIVLDEQITLIAGDNRAGKTTLLMALGALLTRDRAPLSGTMTRDVPAMLRENEATGSAMLSDGDGNQIELSLSAPSTSEILVSGDETILPRASRLAAGLDRWSTMLPAERANILSQAFNCLPTKDDLSNALAELPMVKRDGQKWIDQLWIVLGKQGWDASAAYYDDKLKVERANWKRVTKTDHRGKWRDWRPSNWHRDLIDADPKKLLEAEATANADRDRALAAQTTVAGTTSEKDLHELKTLARRGGSELIQQIDVQAHKAAMAATSMTEAQARHLALREVLPMAREMPCPHCGGLLVIRGGEILEAEVGADLDEPTREQQIAEQKERADTLREEWEAQRQALDELRALKLRSDEAAKQIQKIEGSTKPPAKKKETTTAPLLSLDVADKALAEAKERREARIIYDTAMQHGQSALNWQTVRDILLPDGLRKARLADAIKRAEAALAMSIKELGWPALRIDPETLELAMVLSPGRGFTTLSGAERWVADALMAFAVGIAEKSGMVLIDGADMLENPMARWRGLLGKALKAPIPIVVAAAVRSPDPKVVPDLGRMKLGRTYWVERDKPVRLLADVSSNASVAA